MCAFVRLQCISRERAVNKSKFHNNKKANTTNVTITAATKTTSYNNHKNNVFFLKKVTDKKNKISAAK